MRGKKFWRWLASDNDQIKILFTVLAAAFVIWQYFQTKEENRIKQTMEFQSRFTQGELRDAQMKLNLLLIDKKPELDAAGAKAGQKITELVTKDKLEAQVLMLTDFFGQITTCVENGVCSWAATCAVFKEPIVSLRNNFHDLFSEREKQWGQNFIARPYDYFTTQCGP